MSLEDEDEDVRPEVITAMDALYKTHDPAVKTFLLMADQRGYNEFGKFVMLAHSMYLEKERFRTELLGALLDRQKEYVLVTPEQFEVLTSVGLANSTNRKG